MPETNTNIPISTVNNLLKEHCQYLGERFGMHCWVTREGYMVNIPVGDTEIEFMPFYEIANLTLGINDHDFDYWCGQNQIDLMLMGVSSQILKDDNTPEQKADK